MAYRRHIIAARNTTREAMAQALANAQISEVEEAGGWCWAMASVWTTGSGDLLGALEHLVGPAMLTTTEDGSRWWLHLLRKGQGRQSTFHEFTLLLPGEPDEEDDPDWSDIYDEEDDSVDEGQLIEIGPPPLPEKRLTPLEFEDEFFEEYADEDLEDSSDSDDDEDDDDDEYGASPIEELIEEYEDSGAPLPDELIDALEEVPDTGFKHRFLQLHAAHITDLLQAYDIPHDPDEVQRILNGENVTEGELESDVGNLWRFLAHLGLGSQFEEALEELEAESEEDEEYDAAADILEAVAEHEAVAVEEGPASIPLADVLLLCRITNGLEDNAEFALVAAVDSEGANWPAEPVPAYVESVPVAGGTAILFDAASVPMAPKARKRIGTLLQSLPDQAALSLNALGETTRYWLRGKVHGEAWHVDCTSFPTSARELGELVELFRTAEARTAQDLRDEAEMEAVLEAARHDMNLYNALPQKTGLSLHSASREDANALASILFRHRYRHRWDIESLETRLRENFQEWKALEERMQVESALPVTDKVIFEGAASRFLEPDYDSPSMEEKQRANAVRPAATDQEFAALGFECLGAIVCERVGAGVLRCYANPEERTCAVAYFMPYLDPWYDFVSKTEDGTYLTTTGSAMESSIRSLRILIRLGDEGDMAALHRDHQSGLAKLQDRGMRPAPIEASLEGVARMIDDFLMRRLGPGDEEESG